MIAAFVRLDLASWLPRRQTLLPIALVAVVGIVLPVPGMAIIASAFVTSLLISTPFLHDERGRLDTLYGILPISRGTVVLGRALSVLVLGLLVAAIALAVTFGVALVRGTTVPVDVVLMAIGIAAGVVGLALAVQLPVLFRIGYARGRLIAYAPVFLIAGGAWLAQALGLIGETDLAALPVAPIAAAGLAAGALGLVVGVVAATAAYRSRELR